MLANIVNNLNYSDPFYHKQCFMLEAVDYDHFKDIVANYL